MKRTAEEWVEFWRDLFDKSKGARLGHMLTIFAEAVRREALTDGRNEAIEIIKQLEKRVDATGLTIEESPAAHGFEKGCAMAFRSARETIERIGKLRDEVEP